jgi:hypothetical protein
VAIVFHFGPLQFVFADFRRQSGRFSVWDLLEELKMFVLKQHFHEYSLAVSIGRHDTPLLGPVATTSRSVPGAVVVPWPLLGEMELHVKTWNEWFVRHAVKGMAAVANKKKPAPGLDTACSMDGLTESRFVALMLPSGLVIDILLKPATASLMFRVRREDMFPFELVVRRLLSPSSTSDRRLYFCYAECAKLAGGAASSVQKEAIYALLVQLNATTGLRIDVPLRALRCQNFIDAKCHEGETFRRVKPRANLSSRLESAFG